MMEPTCEGMVERAKVKMCIHETGYKGSEGRMLNIEQDESLTVLSTGLGAHHRQWLLPTRFMVLTPTAPKDRRGERD